MPRKLCNRKNIAPKAVTRLTGIGMGLARANGFIKSLQGEIDVRGNPAQGWRFTTGLPVGRSHRFKRSRARPDAAALPFPAKPLAEAPATLSAALIALADRFA